MLVPLGVVSEPSLGVVSEPSQAPTPKMACSTGRFEQAVVPGLCGCGLTAVAIVLGCLGALRALGRA